jgi:hypothetical protein
MTEKERKQCRVMEGVVQGFYTIKEDWALTNDTYFKLDIIHGERSILWLSWEKHRASAFFYFFRCLSCALS